MTASWVPLPQSLPRVSGGLRQAGVHRRRLAEAQADFGQRAQTLAQELSVPVKSVMLAAHLKAQAVLSGERDVVTGYVANGRPEVDGGDELLGLFLNTLPLRVKVSGSSWRELIQATFRAERALLPHRRFPLPDIRALHGGAELFESAFNYTHFHVYDRLAEGSGQLTDRQGFEHSNFPLVVQAGLAPGGAAAYFATELDGAHFSVEEMERINGVYEAVLASLLRDPAARHDAAAYVSDAETLGLKAWNDVAQPYPAASLAAVFAEQVARQPEAVAVVALGRDGQGAVVERERVSFAELDRRSERLAGRLRERGVGPDVLVGVAVERSVDLVVALLGIAKAGGGYVPLDPAYPQERLESMIVDSGMGVLVAHESVLGELPAYPLALLQTVVLDGSADTSPADEGSAVACPAGPDHLAYVMYTSGSTGVPKGAAITQRAVLRLVKGRDFVEIDPADAVLQMAPASFDASTLEIWGALLNGARLVLAPAGTPDLEALGTVLREQSISVLWLTAPLFHLMVDQKLDDLRGVRQVLAGGDVLLLPQVARFLDGIPEGHWLINGYGPTENTTFTACHRMRALPAGARSVPIGRPISNTQVHVLDAALHPVPVGTPGELMAAGDGLARCYWNSPELTAERFIPNPFGAPGSRLYRTGDLVRWLPDGTLEFLGRLDTQVKVRGFRIETGDVEAALLRHPEVQGAAVTARGAGSDKKLVAYVVAIAEARRAAQDAGRPAFSTEGLQSFLTDLLPAYMVPTSFVELPALPLTPSGKLDRRNLPEPEENGLGEDREHVAPRTSTEQVLCEIWAQALGRERVGVLDNYFELGGDSILSIQIKAQAQARGLEFALQDLFEHQTVEALAAAIEGGWVESEVPVSTAAFALVSEEVRRALPEEVEDAYPLSRLQAGMLYQGELGETAGVYHDVIAYLLELPFAEEALRGALDEVSARHAVLRTAFELTAFADPLQLVYRGARVPLQVHDLRGVAEAAAALAQMLDEARRRPFDWTEAPLVRVHAVRVSEERFHLVLDFHHAVLDGWSEASLFTELVQRYQARRQGQALAAGELRTSYRDFVALEQRALADPADSMFWDSTLEDFTATRVPRVAGGEGTGEGMEAAVWLTPSSLNERLGALARECGVPVKTVLLAAHLKALSVWCGQRDVLTGLVSHGRPETADGERVLGLFLNTVPLRLRLAAGSWRALVQQVFQAEQAALQHRRYPMAELQRRHGSEPLFEVVFNYTHFHVYGELSEEEQSRVQGQSGHVATEFALVANFLVPPGSGELVLSVEGARRLFDVPRVAELRDLYVRTLEAMAAEPAAAHDAAALVDNAARAWSQGPVVPVPANDLAELYAHQVRRTPQGVAVRQGEHTLSHIELDARSNRLAQELCLRGVGPDTVVGIFLEPSRDAVVSVLAVVKAGGAYLPIDPSYPDERVAYIIQDSGAVLVLTETALTSRLGDAAEMLCLDALPPRVPTHPAVRPSVPVQPDHLAYLIYTSGSTGRPKGAGLTHAGVVNLISVQREALPLGSDDALLQFASLGFDASVWELWSALLSGATLVVPTREERLDPEAFAALVAREHVTCALLPPSLLAELDPATVPGLAKLVVGGEACAPSQAERWAVGRRLYNAYGPTEITVYATLHELQPPLHGRVSLGSPIGNVQVHVLDEALWPVPTGTPGELCIGGAGVARGYRGRAVLSAERFVPDPFGAPGSRLYRTGDLAPLPARRDARVPRPHGPAGEDPRLPGGAG